MPHLPSSPESPFYRELFEHIDNSPLLPGAIDFRYWCQIDFWFFLRNCLSIGRLACSDPTNDHYGRRWMDHPYLFERAREHQDDPWDQWRQHPRGYFKSEMYTKGAVLWEFIRALPASANLRALILTQKLEKTGEGFMDGITSEIENNPRLYFHWPDLFWANPTKESPLWGRQAITLKRTAAGAGIKEPSIVVAALDKMPTSQHFDIIVQDDVVTRETVTSKAQVEKAYSAMRQAMFLGGDVTRRVYVGTHWAVDDPWSRGVRDGMFRRDHQDCYDKDGKPRLRSAEYLKIQERAGQFDFAAQMRGKPVMASDRVFSPEWLQDMGNKPEDEAAGKNVYMFCDTARQTNEKLDPDYTVFAVIALGDDKNYYVLDLRRDRWNLREFGDNFFDLAKKWHPKTVFFEQVGANRDMEHLRMEMQNRRWRGTRLAALPVENLPKTTRIERLMNSMSTFRWYFPKRFNYRSRNDARDNYQAFLDDEYLVWNPATKSEHDDMLDTLAMVLNPRLELHWPGSSSPSVLAFNRQRQKSRRGHYSSWVA